MKMMNKNILDAVEGLNSILEDSISLPASVSYAIIRNLKMMLPIAQDIYSERDKIIEKYGTKINDEYYQIPEESRDLANQELSNLLTINTSIPLVTFPLDNLNGYDLPLKTMNILYFMVEDGEV